MEIEIRGLTKKYGSKAALKNLDLTLEKGIYGILGPNGAGKSTLMNLLTDNLKRDRGEILWDGKDILKYGGAYRKKVGFMPQQQGYYEELSARAFLHYMAQLKGIPRRQRKKEVDRMLDRVHLGDVAGKKIGSFSGGMKQRVMLAQAMMGEPRLLILDEPTAGVDPKERIHIRNLISELAEDRIILLATHIVSDIECIADRVLLLKEGELVNMNTPQKLMEEMRGRVGEKPCAKSEIAALQEQYPYGNILQRKNGLVIRVVKDRLPEGFTAVEQDISLEDVYLYYFGE